jgi:chloramphenicol-sensitive protein RarD
MSPTRSARAGLWFGLAAYGWWAFVFPLHVKALGAVAPDEVTAEPVAWSLEILAHRIVWSLLFCLVLCWQRRSFGRLGETVRDRRALGRLSLAAVLVTINWSVFIVAMARGELYRAGIGYFVTPIVQIALGTMLLGERLRRTQWWAVGFAAAGMATLLGIAILLGGELPWIEAALALSFGFYGLVRKGVAAGPVVGLTIETGMLTPFALAWILLGPGLLAVPPAFVAGGSATASLLALTGISTAVPLLCFAAAAARLPLSTIGFLQFTAPTGQVLLGVLAYGERPADPRLWSGYALIWLAVLVLAADMLRARLRRS